MESKLFSHIFVSTDSIEIADIARDAGAEIPFMRPKEISGEMASTADVISHAIEYIERHMSMPKCICCIYATAALLQAKWLKQGYGLFIHSNASCAFAITKFEFSIFRALKIDKDCSLSMCWPEYESTRSNDLPDTYHDAGYFYWLDIQRFKATKRIYSSDAVGLTLPQSAVQDIDTEEDWKLAEIKHALLVKSIT